MTALIGAPTAVNPVTVEQIDVASWRRAAGSPLTWLVTILAVQVGLALRPGTNRTAFEDEGLYVYFGHLVLEHLGHGAAVPGFPGTYFSGSPWLYPPLAALGDSFGGLQGARAVSLFFALVATVGTYGIGSELFGARAGVIGAATFVLNGSVIFQSHLATYDSMAMSLVALAAWLTAIAVRRSIPIWLPVISGLLVLAFFAKYAVAVYAPVVGLVAVGAGWPTQRWKSVRRATFVVALSSVAAVWVVDAWGQPLLKGLVITTIKRTIIMPGGRGFLTAEIVDWIGPWLLLAAIPVVFLQDHRRVDAVLLLGSIVGPLEQVRIGEQVSLSKHVAFGMVFAAPLIGQLFTWLLDRSRRVGSLLLVVTLLNFSLLGLHYSRHFLTGWPDDSPLVSVLAGDIARAGGRPILGEVYASERYALRNLTEPDMWYSTYFFKYRGQEGLPAYTQAVEDHWFGIIYLNSSTTDGEYLQRYLETHDTAYLETATVPQLERGDVVGRWTVYTLRSSQLPDTPKGSP